MLSSVFSFLLGSLKLVSVPPLEPVTRGELGAPLIILPYLVISRFAGLAPQPTFLQNVSFGITIEFKEP
jgi:hypothetical protein